VLWRNTGPRENSGRGGSKGDSGLKGFLKTRPVKVLRHLLLAVFLLGFLAVVVPAPYMVSLKLGGLLGLAGCFLSGGYARRAKENITRAMPELSPARVLEIRNRSFRNLGMNLAEFALLNFRSAEFWKKRVSFQGRDILSEYAGKKGVIYLTAHVGNWELMGAFLVMAGFRVNVVARRISDSFLNRILVGIRSGRGVSTIYRKGRANTKKMIAAMRRKEILGILIDQDTKVGGVFVDFFSRPAYTPTACAQFSRLKGTVVLPGFIYRRKDLTHRVVVMDPVEKTGDPVTDTARHTRIIEDFIRKHPDQWVWMHRRWKRSPS